MFGIKKKKNVNKDEDIMRVNKRVSKKHPPSIISADVNFIGNIISDGIIDIDGKINGNVRADNIIIHKHGQVIGDVVAKNVSASGRVRGVIRAQEVTLLDSADIKGTIIHEKLTIEEGAIVDAKFKQQSTVFLDDNNEESDSIFKRFNLMN